MTVAVIDELFVRVRSTAFFLRFTMFTKILLAAGFTGPFEPRHRIPTLTLDRWERMGFILFAISLLAFFGSTRDLVPGPVSRLAVPTGVAAGVFTLLRFSVVGRRRGREPPASSPGTRAAGRPGR